MNKKLPWRPESLEEEGEEGEEKKESVLVFEVGPEIFAVSTSHVQEVIIIPPSIRESSHTDWEGEITYRRRPVPLIDLRRHFGGLPEGERSLSSQYGIVFKGKGEWIFIVSKILNLLHSTDNMALREDLGWTEAVFTLNDRVVLQIDPQKLVNKLRRS